MRILFHVTQLSIIFFTLLIAKNLWNVYLTVVRDGHIPASMRRSYERDFNLMVWFALLAGSMSLTSIVAYAMGAR